ncbi:MAG: ASKHA domain-containing protein, partial [Lachnospiraceae bacterium]|nr:ASKHA domain-containing protein [Lachnospiraceae bacterium]
MKDKKMRLAVDYGTTTLGYAFIAEDGTVVDTGIRENPGRKYGRDILSRQNAFDRGASERITAAMQEVMEELASSGDVTDEIVVSANTTMNRMLIGGTEDYACSRSYVRRLMEKHSATRTHDTLAVLQYRTLPGFSEYVGGDIVSGVRYLDMDRSGEINLLIDLGTNGEMVLGNKEGFIVSSVAAGPAFEEWGAAHNMYGSKVIDICHRLLKTGIIDKNGTFTDESYIESGFPVSGFGENTVLLTQDDIRDIQLAKAAVRAGVDLLTDRFGIAYDDISRVYLAGGMGEHLS